MSIVLCTLNARYSHTSLGLRYLLANSGRVLTRAQILDHVWEYDFGGESSVIETFMSYLRRKVDFVEPKLIHTIRGVGYCLRAE